MNRIQLGNMMHLNDKYISARSQWRSSSNVKKSYIVVYYQNIEKEWVSVNADQAYMYYFDILLMHLSSRSRLRSRSKIMDIYNLQTIYYMKGEWWRKRVWLWETGCMCWLSTTSSFHQGVAIVCPRSPLFVAETVLSTSHLTL
jgi:hypothetical protein